MIAEKNTIKMQTCRFYKYNYTNTFHEFAESCTKSTQLNCTKTGTSGTYLFFFIATSV